MNRWIDQDLQPRKYFDFLGPITWRPETEVDLCPEIRQLADTHTAVDTSPGSLGPLPTTYRFWTKGHRNQQHLHDAMQPHMLGKYVT